MNPFKFFDKVYCLNLPERKDRWSICKKSFEKYSIDNFERISAIKIDSSSTKSSGQIGCALSFCKMIDKAIEENLDSVLILEDDFEFTLEPEEFLDKVSVATYSLPKKWDMFYLGANVVSEFYKEPLEEYSENLYRLKSGFALHSVAISRKGLISIKNSFNSDNWHQEIINNYEAIDIFFARDFQINNECFITKSLLSLQRPDFSNIEGTFFDYQRLMLDRFEYFKK